VGTLSTRRGGGSFPSAYENSVVWVNSPSFRFPLFQFVSEFSGRLTIVIVGLGLVVDRATRSTVARPERCGISLSRFQVVCAFQERRSDLLVRASVVRQHE